MKLQNGGCSCLFEVRLLRKLFFVDVPKDPSQHFQLKAPNGDTIVLVNSAEVAVSALHYCSQLGSILVGYNFGALQLWDIINMELVYTSPVYEKNIPVSHFAIQVNAY